MKSLSKAMIPEELFKRRHHGTPESFTLIIVNAIVIALTGPALIKCHEIHWFFWLILAGLTVYNFFTVRRHRDAFDKAGIIAYAISVAVLLGVVVMLALKDC